MGRVTKVVAGTVLGAGVLLGAASPAFAQDGSDARQAVASDLGSAAKALMGAPAQAGTAPARIPNLPFLQAMAEVDTGYQAKPIGSDRLGRWLLTPQEWDKYGVDGDGDGLKDPLTGKDDAATALNKMSVTYSTLLGLKVPGVVEAPKDQTEVDRLNAILLHAWHNGVEKTAKVAASIQPNAKVTEVASNIAQSVDYGIQ